MLIVVTCSLSMDMFEPKNGAWKPIMPPSAATSQEQAVTQPLPGPTAGLTKCDARLIGWHDRVVLELARRWPLPRRARYAATLAVAAATLVACSSTGHPTATTTTGSTAATTNLPPTAATTTTTLITSTTTSRTSTTLPAQPPAGSIPFITHTTISPPDGVSPAGSGCTPHPTTSLPDGRWFGMLKTVTPDTGTLGLDLACFYGGRAANHAAKAAGYPVPVPNDNFIDNTNKVYTLRTVSDVAVGILGANSSAVTYYPTKTGLTAATPAINVWVWVDITQSWVVAIQQQYIP